MKKHFDTKSTTQRITIRTVHLQRKNKKQKTKTKKLIVQKTQQPEYKLPPYTGKHKTHSRTKSTKKQKQEKPVKTIHPPPPPRIFPILINPKHIGAKKKKKQEPPSPFPSFLSSSTHSLL